MMDWFPHFLRMKYKEYATEAWRIGPYIGNTTAIGDKVKYVLWSKREELIEQKIRLQEYAELIQREMKKRGGPC